MPHPHLLAGTNPTVLPNTEVRKQETLLGNLIADAQLWYLRTRTTLQIDAALVNGGGIRTALPAGDVTSLDLLSILPFGNTLIVKRMSGSTLVAALENGVNWDLGGNSLQGRFPQVGGLKYTLDPSATPGNRVKYVAIVGPDGTETPVESCTEYNVAMNDFVGNGGDAYTMFKPLPATDLSAFGGTPILDDVLGQYIGAFSPVSVSLSGRITYCSASDTEGVCAKISDTSSSGCGACAKVSDDSMN